jgi:hypothetical protein
MFMDQESYILHPAPEERNVHDFVGTFRSSGALITGLYAVSINIRLLRS